MENRAHALAAGLFALILGAGIALALWWFSQEREPVRELVLVAQGDINGLGAQSRVRFRGLAVGAVSSVHIDPDDSRNVLVHVRVTRDLPLTRGARASLGTLGVTGLAYVQLDDRGGEPLPLVEASGLPPRIELQPGLLDVLAERALEMVGQFQRVSERIAVLLDDDTLGRVRAALSSIESAASGFDRSLAEMPQTLQSVRSAFTPANLAALSGLLASLERTSAEVAPTLGELRQLLRRLDTMAVRVDQAAVAASDGLLEGTLPQLNELLRDLSATSRRISRLVEEVDSTPQVLLTGRPATEPGPGEAGFSSGR